jgi:HAE1 family hydrophobic/amphiphilic exporter-1
MGFTLNMLTMLALTLSVGIVIDDAIVVLENIYRFIEEKACADAGGVEATQEIGLAVLATTLSLVAIFVPVGFMSGMVGRFMKSFGLTMAFAIMVSLVVSFTLTPMMSARWLKVDATARASILEDSIVLPRHRRLYRAARVVDAHSRHRRGSRCSCCCRASRCSASVEELHRRRTISRVRDQPARAEGTSLEGDESDRTVARAVRAQAAGGDYTLVTVGADPAARATWRRLSSGSTDRAAYARSVRDHGDRPTVLPPRRAGPADVGHRWPTIGGGGRRTRHQFLINGPDLRKLDVLSKQLCASEGRSRVVDPDTRRSTRQAGAVGADRSAEGGGPRRPDWRCGRALRCWSAAIR